MGLNESTFLKGIAYGKLDNGIEACKYGKKWVISVEAMRREVSQKETHKMMVGALISGARGKAQRSGNWIEDKPLVEEVWHCLA